MRSRLPAPPRPFAPGLPHWAGLQPRAGAGSWEAPPHTWPAALGPSSRQGAPPRCSLRAYSCPDSSPHLPKDWATHASPFPSGACDLLVRMPRPRLIWDLPPPEGVASPEARRARKLPRPCPTRRELRTGDVPDLCSFFPSPPGNSGAQSLRHHDTEDKPLTVLHRQKAGQVLKDLRGGRGRGRRWRSRKPSWWRLHVS